MRRNKHKDRNLVVKRTVSISGYSSHLSCGILTLSSRCNVKKEAHHGMKNANKDEMNRLCSYAEKDMYLSQIALLEHISIPCAKKKYMKYFGVNYTHLRVVISSLAAFASVDNKYLQSSATCIIDKSKIYISEPKSLYLRIRVVFRTTYGKIVQNMKQKKGESTMRDELINLTKNDKILIAQVLAKLNDSSKESPIRLTFISDSLGYTNNNVRRVIVWLRRLGVPIISRPGRYNGGYFFATRGSEASDEQDDAK